VRVADVQILSASDLSQDESHQFKAAGLLAVSSMRLSMRLLLQAHPCIRHSTVWRCTRGGLLSAGKGPLSTCLFSRPFSTATQTEASGDGPSLQEETGGTAAQTPQLNLAAEEALSQLSSTLKVNKANQKPKQLSKKDLRKLEGSAKRYRLMGGRPEFHNIDRNKNDRIIEPTDRFRVRITSSKNNCWINVQNCSRDYRIVMTSHGGNVGIRGAAKQLPASAYRIAQNIARKCRRLGITHADCIFRRVTKVDQCLQAFQAHGLTITSLVHAPHLPKGSINKPRKRRRV